MVVKADSVAQPPNLICSVSMIQPAILAGGVGARLWPLSTEHKPKQFLPLAGDQSIMQQALGAEDARRAISQIVEVVGQWRGSFFACGVSAEDIEYIAPAMLPECFFFEKQPGQ